MPYYLIATSPTIMCGTSFGPKQLGPFPTQEIAMQAANSLLSSQNRTGILWNIDIIGSEDGEGK